MGQEWARGGRRVYNGGQAAQRVYNLGPAARTVFPLNNNKCGELGFESKPQVSEANQVFDSEPNSPHLLLFRGKTVCAAGPKL